MEITRKILTKTVENILRKKEENSLILSEKVYKYVKEIIEDDFRKYKPVLSTTTGWWEHFRNMPLTQIPGNRKHRRKNNR